MSKWTVEMEETTTRTVVVDCDNAAEAATIAIERWNREDQQERAMMELASGYEVGPGVPDDPRISMDDRDHCRLWVDVWEGESDTVKGAVEPVFHVDL